MNKTIRFVAILAFVLCMVAITGRITWAWLLIMAFMEVYRNDNRK